MTKDELEEIRILLQGFGAITMFDETMKRVDKSIIVLDRELSKLHQPTVSEQVNEVGMEGHDNGCGCWMCNDLRGE